MEKKYIKGTHIEDLTGMKFGKLEVIGFDFERLKDDKRRKKLGEIKAVCPHFFCLCICERQITKSIKANHLKYGNTVSCGCHTLETAKKKARAKAITGVSFYDWCIENNHKDWLDLWDYELNSETPEEVTCSSGMKFYFKCPNGIHKSELKIITVYTRANNTISCNECNSFGQYLLDTYGESGVDLYWSNKNKVNPFSIAKYSKTAVFIKCQIKDYHDEYVINCSDFSNNKRCPFCANKQIHRLDSLGCLFPQVLDIWSDKNDKTAYEYSPNSGKKVWWKCIDGGHEDFYRCVDLSNKVKFRCPSCTRERSESFLQEKVRLYMTEQLKYELKHEYNCGIIPKNKKNKRCLPFDNEVIELKLIIEVHGEQHYSTKSIIHSNWCKNLTPDENLYKIRLYDRYKSYVAYINGYHYLEIPYWTEKDESYKTLIDDKIKEIKGDVYGKSNI